MECCDTDVVKMSLDPAADTAVCGPSHPVSLNTGNVLLPSPSFGTLSSGKSVVWLQCMESMWIPSVPIPAVFNIASKVPH